MATFQSKLHFLPYCVGLSKSNVTEFCDPVLFCASRTRSLVCFCLFNVFVRVPEPFQRWGRVVEHSRRKIIKASSWLFFFSSLAFVFFWCVFPSRSNVFLHLNCCTDMDLAELCLRHVGVDDHSVRFPDQRCPASPSVLLRLGFPF